MNSSFKKRIGETKRALVNFILEFKISVSAALYVVNGRSNSFVRLRCSKRGKKKKKILKGINFQITFFKSKAKQSNERTGKVTTKVVRTAPVGRCVQQTSLRLYDSPFLYILSYRVEQTVATHLFCASMLYSALL